MSNHMIKNDHWILMTCPTTGIIERLYDVTHQRELITNPGGKAFILETKTDVITSFTGLKTQTSDTTLSQSFELSDGSLVETTICLNEQSIECTCHVRPHQDMEVHALEFPIISGLTSFDGTDVLAHSYATGLLIKRPSIHFNQTHPGLRYAPYPESFSGASMQFFAYYGSESGILMMAKDDKMHQKWLNFYHHEDRLVASHIFGYEHLKKGKDLLLPYMVSITSFAGDWMTASDIYKSWAVKQSFVPKPTMARKHATWLYQTVGLSTFGINAGHDRRLWLRRYHKDLGVPIFHILGPDWTNHPQAFRGVNPGGLDEWIPTKFNHDNLKLIKEQGDYVAPFEFDFLVNPNRSDKENIQAHLQVFPKPPKSHDNYHFNMLCPANPYTMDFHVKRDTIVLKESNVDAFYYDISSNNLIKTCMSESHAHDKGGGHEITNAYNAIYHQTKQALEKIASKPVPLGAEMACEVHLKTLDYAQARAWAQPASTLETYPFRHLILRQEASVIPMFSYVYHEYGLLRLDGWGKLVKEIGTLFYHTVAKTYLDGGLYEINHEYAPMEMIEGIENKSEEHYIGFKARDYPYDSTMMAYVRMFATLRTRDGNPYLAYGKMIRPLEFKSPMTNFDYFHYNHTPEVESYEARGTVTLPAVVTSAYERIDHPDDIAYFFANTSDQKVTIDVTLPSRDIQRVTLYDDFQANGNARESVIKTTIQNGQTIITLDLDQRSVVMLKVTD